MPAAMKRATAFAVIAVAALLADCSAEAQPYYHGIDLFPERSTALVGPCCHDDFYDHVGGGHR